MKTHARIWAQTQMRASKGEKKQHPTIYVADAMS